MDTMRPPPAPDPFNKDLEYDELHVNKCQLKTILRRQNQRCTGIIDDFMMRTHKLVIQGYHFTRLFFLHLYDNKLPFPRIDDNYAKTILRTLTISSPQASPFT